MPQLLNNPENDNKYKMRMTQNYMKQFKDDRIIAPTESVGKGIDALLTQCEALETEAELLLQSIDRAVLIGDVSKVAGLYSFFKEVQKALQVLKRTNFKQVPKTDVASLSSYKDSLDTYYSAFESRFGDIYFETVESKIRESDYQQELLAEIQDLKDKIQHKYQLNFTPKIQYSIQKDEEKIKELEKKIPGKRRYSGVTEIDKKSVLTNFKVFLDTLGDAIMMYSSGISGFINKRGSTQNTALGAGKYLLPHVTESLPTRYT